MSCVCSHDVDRHVAECEHGNTACVECACEAYTVAVHTPPLIDVTTAIADAVLVEREACAELVEQLMRHDFDGGRIAKAIRARGGETI